MRVFKEGGIIAIQDDSGNYVTPQEPAGALRAEINGDKIALIRSVNQQTVLNIDFSDYNDASGTPYGGDVNTVVAALNAFLGFSSAGSVSPPTDIWTAFLETYGVITNISLTADQIIGHVLKLDESKTIDKVRFGVTGSNVAFYVTGIYKLTGTDQWDLVVQFPGSFDMSIAGTQELTLASPLTLSTGIYAMVLHGDAAASGFRINRPAVPELLGYDTTLNTSAYRNSLNVADVYTGTLPSSITADATATASTPLLIYHTL